MAKERNFFTNSAVILANGDFPSHPIALNHLENNKIIICTDGAADKILDIGKKPDFIIGDLDSTKIKKSNRSENWIEINNQNKTDLEKSFDWCIKNNILEITLLGAGGGREDHLFGNSFTLANYYDKVKCEMITNYAKIICVKGKNYIESVADQDISIIATEKIDSISLDGLQYTMKNQILNPSARAICNKSITNEFYIESTGKVLVILNHVY